MKKYLPIVLIFYCCAIHAVMSQQIVVQPYLQDAEPDRITVMWETDNDNSSQVEYGITTALGTTVNGAALTGNGSSQIHYVTLTGLQPGTRYYYKVITGAAISSVYHFMTPKNKDQEGSTNLIAMSDMQQDWLNPTKFDQIIHNGILQYMNDSVAGELNDAMQMVIIPGDLVDNGLVYSQWETTFFDPAADLFSYVPVYPVLGNHEQNTPTYFKYFSLPQNGTSGYDEHWWYKDHSNVRIIGLNSNGTYQVQAQLNWLDMVLQDAAADTSIDFVFAQMHHPYHSELWPPGETGYSGSIISLLENFSTSTGKPSIHFFGHTHAYSRGQSRDHNHLMVNVATAGGNIDYWGEYTQIDYPEYIMSEDNYGWVYVTVEAGNNPRFTLKRYNIGDETNVHGNQLEDQVTVKRYNSVPVQPVGLFPGENNVVNPHCLVLKGNDFNDPDNDGFGAAHWQVSGSCGDFSAPVVDSWKQYMNRYNEIDLQLGDDLTDERVTSLQPLTNYCWRVRYRDKSLGWSDWSAPIAFSTDSVNETANLLVNGDAENGTNGWTATAGVIESLTAGECGGTVPYNGVKYFAVGAVCTDNAWGAAYQDVDVATYSGDIDQGIAVVRFGGYLRDWSGSDVPSFTVQFLDQSATIIGHSDTTSRPVASWTLTEQSWGVPAGTKTIRMVLMGQRNAGSDNDSYFDDLFLKLDLSGDSCSQYTAVNTTGTENVIEEQEHLKVYPNPVTNEALVNVPGTQNMQLNARVIDVQGKTVKTMYNITGPTFYFERGGLRPGLYFLLVYHEAQRVGVSKIIIK